MHKSVVCLTWIRVTASAELQIQRTKFSVQLRNLDCCKQQKTQRKGNRANPFTKFIKPDCQSQNVSFLGSHFDDHFMVKLCIYSLSRFSGLICLFSLFFLFSSWITQSCHGLLGALEQHSITHWNILEGTSKANFFPDTSVIEMGFV